MREQWRKLGLIVMTIGLVIVFAVCRFLENETLSKALEKVEGDAVKFSKESGVYGESIKVGLSADFELPMGTEVRYTLNGDDPRKSGEKYTEEILLEMEKDALKVYPVNATVCFKGECREVYERTYVVDKYYTQRIGIDIISITSAHEGLYSYSSGILVPGMTYDINKPKNPNSGYIAGNYSNRGEEWIRDAHVVRINHFGDILWDQDIGIRVSGMTSALLENKSLKLYANEKYGYSGNLAIDFYTPEESSTTSMVTNYNTLKLRSGSQDMAKSANIRSSVTSVLAKESGFDGCTETARAAVYLNGDFYGVYDIQQSYSNSFLAKKFSLAESDLVEKEKGPEERVLKNNGVWDKFTADLTIQKNREALEKAVDMDNFLKQYALEILLNNTDWPQNNYEIWRYTGEYDETNKYTDGKWRFLMYDMDLIYYSYSYEFFDGARGDTFAHIMENKIKGTNSVFQNTIKADAYKKRFLQIMEELINGPFRTENVLKVIDEEAEKIRAVEYMRGNEEDWTQKVKAMRDVAAKREAEVRADVKKYLGYEMKTGLAPSVTSVQGAWETEGLKIVEMAPKGGSDWMKFQNMGTEEIRLGDYYISDNKEKLQKYQLPLISLPAGKAIIINGKNNFYLLGEYICNFNLSEGETLYLSKDGDIVDEMVVPRMDKYETVGRDLVTGERMFYYNRNEERKHT